MFVERQIEMCLIGGMSLLLRGCLIGNGCRSARSSSPLRMVLENLSDGIKGMGDGMDKRSAGSVVQTQFPQPERLIVVGDIHGDEGAFLGCLKIAGLVDDDGNWIGGETHFVQLGDILDRGDGEKAVLDHILRLQPQAAQAGGRIDVVLGNHEVMNAELDFRYVTPGAWETWGMPEDAKLRSHVERHMEVLGYPDFMMERIAAFKAGGEVTRQMADMPVAMVVGDTLLAHGGIRMEHLEFGLEELNTQTKEWLLNERLAKPAILGSGSSPVWTRIFSAPSPQEAALEEMCEVLKRLGAKRMVVGHTPQLTGINCATLGGYEVWRTDTGMSSGMMCGPVECLEVLKDGTVNILTEAGPISGDLRRPSAVGEFPDVCDLDTGICTPQQEGSSPVKQEGSPPVKQRQESEDKDEGGSETKGEEVPSLADLIRASRAKGVAGSRAGANEVAKSVMSKVVSPGPGVDASAKPRPPPPATKDASPSPPEGKGPKVPAGVKVESSAKAPRPPPGPPPPDAKADSSPAA